MSILLNSPGAAVEFDVFLSHNSGNKRHVRRLAQRLGAHGLRVWFDEWALIPGQPWQEALEEAIERSAGVAVLLGSDGLGRWHGSEMRAAIAEFVRLGRPVIPVLMPDAPDCEINTMPLFLRQFSWVDLRGGIRKPGVEKIIWGIRGSK